VFIYDNPQSTPIPTSPPNYEDGYIRIVNQSDIWEILYVYFKISGSYDWGDDMLGDYETINTNSSRTFDVFPGTYDVMITDDSEYSAGIEHIVVYPDTMVTLYFDDFDLEL